MSVLNIDFVKLDNEGHEYFVDLCNEHNIRPLGIAIALIKQMSKINNATISYTFDTDFCVTLESGSEHKSDLEGLVNNLSQSVYNTELDGDIIAINFKLHDKVYGPKDDATQNILVGNFGDHIFTTLN